MAGPLDSSLKYHTDWQCALRSGPQCASSREDPTHSPSPERDVAAGANIFVVEPDVLRVQVESAERLVACRGRRDLQEHRSCASDHIGRCAVASNDLHAFISLDASATLWTDCASSELSRCACRSSPVPTAEAAALGER